MYVARVEEARCENLIIFVLNLDFNFITYFKALQYKDKVYFYNLIYIFYY